MKKQHLTLTKSDRAFLLNLLKKGSLTAKTYKRATALLELDRNKTITDVASTLNVSYPSVLSWRNKYLNEGLTATLHDKPRSGRPVLIEGKQRAKLTALACSCPPNGHARWTLRLLADKAVELGYCEQLSHSHAGRILKKTRSSRI